MLLVAARFESTSLRLLVGAGAISCFLTKRARIIQATPNLSKERGSDLDEVGDILLGLKNAIAHHQSMKDDERDQVVTASRVERSDDEVWPSSASASKHLDSTKGRDLPLICDEHPLRRAIRREQLRQIVPLGDTTIYELEQRGEFPHRFYLTSRCVVWDLGEVEAWLKERRRRSDLAQTNRAPSPDVRRRKTRPVKR